jgi:hypothetical protein
MSKITKNVKVTVDIETAKMMLEVAGCGYLQLQDKSDDEIFELVLHVMACYGATTKTGETLEDINDG